MNNMIKHDDPSPSARSTTSKPVFADVFAGCGGLSLGLMNAGWTGLLAIERDSFAFDTLSSYFPSEAHGYPYRWPSNIRRRPWDIHDLLSEHRDELVALQGSVDLLAGGPPCQGFSCAGRRRSNDPRNALFREYLDLVTILRPRLVLIENVRGFNMAFQYRDGREGLNFAQALQTGLSHDYCVGTSVIRAADFGVPQTRPRFFLVGALKEAGLQHDVTTFFDELRANVDGFLRERALPRNPTAHDAISDLEVSRNGTVPCPDTPGFQSIGYGSAITTYQQYLRERFDGAPSDTRLARHRPDIQDRFRSIIQSCQDEGRLSISISAETRRSHGLKKTSLRVLDPLSCSPTITSLPDDLLHYSEPRTLTVRETARLQTFPDWFAFKGKYTTGGQLRRREAPRFTQVANAVSPLLAEQLGLMLLRMATRSNLHGHNREVHNKLAAGHPHEVSSFSETLASSHRLS